MRNIKAIVLIILSIVLSMILIVDRVNHSRDKPVIAYETVKITSDKMVDNMIELYSVNGIDLDPNHFNDNTEKDLKQHSLDNLIQLLEEKGYTIK